MKTLMMIVSSICGVLGLAKSVVAFSSLLGGIQRLVCVRCINFNELCWPQSRVSLEHGHIHVFALLADHDTLSQLSI